MWGQGARRHGHHTDRDVGARAESQAALGLLRMASSLSEAPETDLLLAECSRAVKAWARSCPRGSL